MTDDAKTMNLQKLNGDRLDDLARQLVLGGHEAWTNQIAPAILEETNRPAAVRLLIDASERGKENEDVLSIKLLKFCSWMRDGQGHDGATQDDLERCRAFPQKKYLERTNEWIVAVTPTNVDHLLASWKEGEYQLTAGAQLTLATYFGTVQAANKHLNVREQFLADGVVPKLEDYLYVEGMPPYPHQAVGFESGRHAEFFGYIMDPGTGKTRVAWDVVCDRARRQRKAWLVAQDAVDDADPAVHWDGAPQYRVLIVAPKTVLRTWEREIQKWSTLDVNVERLTGNKLQRVGLLSTLFSDKETPILAAIINYDGLEILEDYLKAPDGRQIWDYMICDESIAIKNPDAKRSKVVYRIGGAAKSRAILNGTPISKNVLDLYGQYHFLKPGCLGFSTFSAFETYYGEKNYYGGHQGYRKEKLPELQERLARFSFVIKRSQCVDLPAKIREVIEPELSDEQRSAYEQMAEEMIVDLEKVEAGETLDAPGAAEHELKLMLGGADESKLSTAQIVLVRMLRLAQITSGFMTMKDRSLYVFPHQPKLDALEEHLASLQDDQRIVVWSRFRPEIDACVARFEKEYGACALYGGLNDRTREGRLDAHLHGKRISHVYGANPCRLIVVQPQTGGFGLNELIGSTDVNYLSNEWSLMYREQSEDRTHRIGVNASVLYSDYVIPNTIDQIMMERIQMKRELSELLTNPAAIVASLRAQLGAMRAR